VSGKGHARLRLLDTNMDTKSIVDGRPERDMQDATCRRDILACCDRLAGLPEAIEAAFGRGCFC
jgi:hypothetical protein